MGQTNLFTSRFSYSDSNPNMNSICKDLLNYTFHGLFAICNKVEHVLRYGKIVGVRSWEQKGYLLSIKHLLLETRKYTVFNAIIDCHIGLLVKDTQIHPVIGIS